MTVLFPCLNIITNKTPKPPDMYLNETVSRHLSENNTPYSSCLFLVIIALKHKLPSHLCHLANLAQSLERAQAESEALASAAYPHESGDGSICAFLLHAQIGQSILTYYGVLARIRFQ
jgi:hypothetical protein